MLLYFGDGGWYFTLLLIYLNLIIRLFRYWCALFHSCLFRLRKLLISTVLLLLYIFHLCTFRSLSFSVCFVAQGPTDVLWDFRPSFFGFRPLWWPVCFGELRTLKGLSRFQSIMAFYLAHLPVENCLICLGICLKFCDLDCWELNVYCVILRLGRLHFHAIFFIWDYSSICVKERCVCCSAWICQALPSAILPFPSSS